LAHHQEPILKDDDKRRLGAGARSFGFTAIVVGVVALGAALLLAKLQGGGLERFGFAYVVNYAYFLSLALGGLFLVLVTHLFRAGWVVAVRRIAEVMGASMPVMAVLFVPILLYVLMGNGMLYPWAAAKFDDPSAHGGHGAIQQHDAQIITVSNEETPGHDQDTDQAETPGHDRDTEHAVDVDTDPPESGLAAERAAHHAGLVDALVPDKRPYLTRWFFTLRWVLYLAVWSGLGLYYLKTSAAQDSVTSGGGDRVKLTRKMEVMAAPGTLLFAVTLTFAAFDLMMTLDPVWFSTMWGVYYFAGSAVGSVSALTLALMALQRAGYLSSVSDEHYHDLGKLLFAFVFFWGYIAFSQFMLIWYANLPETNYWFELRGITTQAGNPFISGWTWVVLALLFGHLLIPFLGLLSRWVKRSRKLLAFWAVWLLVMHWVDLWWGVMPNYSTPNPPVPTVELLCLVGVGGIAVGAAVLRATRQGLIAAGDPRLGDSLGHVNVY
jgi:hypothetical protein